MAKMIIPASPTLYYTYYDNLKGADFTSDPTQVDKRRSPDVLNMIKDNGNIVKRKGWHRFLSYNGKIKKMFKYNGEFYCITNKNFYEEHKVIYSGDIEKCCVSKLNDKVAIFLNGRFYYIFKNTNPVTGKSIVHICDMLRNDDTHFTKDSGAEPYVPNVVISRNPDGTGGTFLESVNMLTPKRMISFLSDGTSTSYHLYPKQDESENPSYMGICVDTIKVEKMNSLGYFETLEKGTDYTCKYEHSEQGFDQYGNIRDFQISMPIINFTNAPEKSYVTGQDNIRVTFESYHTSYGQNNKTLRDFLKCEISIPYGKTSDDRIFCAIDNKIYYSDVNRLNYWPDDNYVVVGNDGDIVCMTRVNEYMAVIKEKSDVDNTVFLIKGSEYDGKTVFVVESTIGNVGAVGDTLTMLNDEPLFLSDQGICAISNSYVNTEKMVRNRSRLLDGKLLKEKNLQNAVAASWNGYYILCVNNHAYLLDGNQTARDKVDQTNYVYEGYFWNNIPAVCIAELDGELCFGTEDGLVYKYNDGISGEIAYMDDIEPLYDDNAQQISWQGGMVINSRWATPLDDDGKPQYFKTLNKKGSTLTVLPYDKSSILVYCSKDGNSKEYVGKAFVDTFNWDNIDFNRLSFNSNETAQDVYVNKKVKKYKRLQFIFENNEPEPFGLTGFVKTYTIGNFAK